MEDDSKENVCLHCGRALPIEVDEEECAVEECPVEEVELPEQVAKQHVAALRKAALDTPFKLGV